MIEPQNCFHKTRTEPSTSKSIEESVIFFLEDSYESKLEAWIEFFFSFEEVMVKISKPGMVCSLGVEKLKLTIQFVDYLRRKLAKCCHLELKIVNQTLTFGFEWRTNLTSIFGSSTSQLEKHSRTWNFYLVSYWNRVENHIGV